MCMVRCRLHFNMEGHGGGAPSQPALQATEGLSFKEPRGIFVVRWTIKLTLT